ncbi:proton-conducting transporter membrane subunit [Wukongibacter baidiensis]|uniref:complex I subunit 5 family protein n=1 Tax=Wukongibacter baidiensis TaxID=1723361 RepID=UPI003D7F3C2D
MDLIPIYLIFIPIITSITIYIFHNKYISYLVFLSQSIVTFLSIRYYSFFDEKTTKTLVFGDWPKEIGIALKNDYLSLLFIFLTLFIWWIVIIYCWDKRKQDYKFLFFLMFLEGAFLGIIQTNDLFNLFVFIEITTILSSILILYKKDGYSVRAGLYYLLFNSVGMIFYLIGLIFLYNISGTLNIDIITQRIALLRDTDSIRLSYIFIMAAIGVKSAFFPVYNWLPKAHSAAPSSISALLSGLLVKSGLYAFIRLNAMYGIEEFKEFFFLLGFFTALSGVVFAVSQKDIKQILAFHTISQIGIILMGLSSFYGKTFYGGVFHILNHALFKSLLFMGAGIIINTYGKRRITEIRGVFKVLPFTSILMIIGMLSITGAPFFNGFISKTIIKYGLKESAYKSYMFYILNLGTSVSFVKLSQIFFGKSDVKKYNSIGENMAMFLLGLGCISLGIFFVPIGKTLLYIDLKFIKLSSLSIWINYFITLVIAYFIYLFFISKELSIIKKIRHINISFGTANFLLVLFIFIMIMWKFI